jgi:hypothetical protein
MAHEPRADGMRMRPTTRMNHLPVHASRRLVKSTLESKRRVVRIGLNRLQLRHFATGDGTKRWTLSPTAHDLILTVAPHMMEYRVHVYQKIENAFIGTETDIMMLHYYLSSGTQRDHVTLMRAHLYAI